MDITRRVRLVYVYQPIGKGTDMTARTLPQTACMAAHQYRAPASAVARCVSRRAALELLAGGAAITFPIACRGGLTGTRPQQAARPQVAGKLTFWRFGESDPSYPAWQERLKAFREAYPQATVEEEAVTDVETKLATVVAAGTPPDVSVYDRYRIPTGAARQVMRDIMPMARTAGIRAEQYQPWTWQEVFIGGKLYGLPYTTDSRMVYVNAAHLAQAGISKTPPRTLEEFTQITDRLIVREGQAYRRLGFIAWVGNWGLFGWGWLFGGDFYDPQVNRATLDHPRIIAALQWVGEQAARLGYALVEEFRKPFPGSNDPFLQQALSAHIQSSSFLPPVMQRSAELDWIVWPPPPPQGVDRTHTWSGGFAVVLPTGAKNPDASFELMRYVSDAAFQRVQARTGLRLPPLKEVAQDPFWNTVDPRVKQFVDMLPYSHSRPPIPQIDLLTQELGAAMNVVVQGQKTARDALQEANQRVNQAIAEGRVG